MSLTLFDKFMDMAETSTTLDEAKAFVKAARIAFQENSKKVLVLEESPAKIEAIKAVREIFGYGLKEAKDKVETANYELGSFHYSEAMRIKSRLEAASCKVRMV